MLIRGDSWYGRPMRRWTIIGSPSQWECSKHAHSLIASIFTFPHRHTHQCLLVHEFVPQSCYHPAWNPLHAVALWIPAKHPPQPTRCDLLASATLWGHDCLEGPWYPHVTTSPPSFFPPSIFPWPNRPIVISEPQCHLFRVDCVRSCFGLLAGDVFP